MSTPGGAPEGQGSADAQGVLEIDATLTNPFAIMATMNSVNIDVNGQRFPGRWDRNAATYPAGQYNVRVTFKSWMGDWSPASAVVAIYAGHATVLKYDPGWFWGLDAKLLLKGYVPLSPQS